MAEDKSKPQAPKAPESAAKRPYATLDLKATEVRISPVKPGQASSASAASAAAATPGPAPASSYAMPDDKPSPSSTASATANGSTKKSTSSETPLPSDDRVVVQKRGGFFSHLAAGIAGGLLAFSAAEWAVPTLGVFAPVTRIADQNVELSARIAKLESDIKSSAASTAPADTKAINAITARVDALEKTSSTIPGLVESQTRLVAETKAALAGAEAEAGSPELIGRLAKLEEKLKAIADAGATDPNSGRLEQLAALTGKVSDLETALATRLTELRKSVAEDVEARITSATEASEAAKSGTQRLDRDIATIKTDSVAIEERLAALKAENDKLAASVKLADEKAAGARQSIDQLATNTARAADISAAVAPVSERIATLEQSVQNVIKLEEQRRAQGQNVVLALQLQNLKRALDQGRPFAAEYEELTRASGGKLDLSPLEKVKDSGVPPIAEIAKEFRATANAAIDADSEAPDSGVVDRLWAGAKSIVRVRRTNLDAGDKSTEATIARMETALRDLRLADVLTEAHELSPKAQEAARPFLDRVAARLAVDSAITNIETQLKSSVAGSAAEPKATP